MHPNDNSRVSSDEVSDLVETVIEENEVVVFMKGNELMPQCGYSKTAVDLVTHYKDDVETVNVLDAPDTFRDALEDHSDWTTIPQVFVDGEFVGGSDILQQLHERDELADVLNAEPVNPPF